MALFSITRGKILLTFTHFSCCLSYLLWIKRPEDFLNPRVLWSWTGNSPPAVVKYFLARLSVQRPLCSDPCVLNPAERFHWMQARGQRTFSLCIEHWTSCWQRGCGGHTLKAVLAYWSQRHSISKRRPSEAAFVSRAWPNRGNIKTTRSLNSEQVRETAAEVGESQQNLSPSYAEESHPWPIGANNKLILAPCSVGGRTRLFGLILKSTSCLTI